MRLRTKDQKNFLKVGIFISFLCFILMIMVTSIGKETSLFDAKTILRARVSNVSNLRIGSYVEFKGIRIGTVEDISIISDNDIEIRMKVLQDLIKWIKKDSKVSISTAGLVGDKFVEISGGSQNTKVFSPQTDILESEEALNVKNIISKGENITLLTEKILTRLDRVLLKIEEEKYLTETLNSLRNSGKNMEQITTEIKKSDIGLMIKNINSTFHNVNQSSLALSNVLHRIERGPGTLNSLIYDDGVHDSLRALLGGAQRNKAINYFIRESIKNSSKRKSEN